MNAPAPYDSSSLRLDVDARCALSGALLSWRGLSTSQQSALKGACCTRAGGVVTSARIRNASERLSTSRALADRGMVARVGGIWLLTPLGLLIREVGLG